MKKDIEKLLKMDLQFFADDNSDEDNPNEDNPNENNSSGEDSSKAKDVEFTEEQQEYLNRLMAQAKSKGKTEGEKSAEMKLQDQIDALTDKLEADKLDSMTEEETLEQLKEENRKYREKENYNRMLGSARNIVKESEIKAKTFLNDELLGVFVDTQSAEQTKINIDNFVEVMKERDELVLNEALKNYTLDPKTKNVSKKNSEQEVNPFAEKRNQMRKNQSDVLGNWANLE